MRTIKFRAWDISKKKMFLPHKSFNKYLRNEDEQYEIGYFWDNEYYILLQYTGLKDKNGKEIYEGDIVKSNFGIIKEEPREIVWHLGAFAFKGSERDKLYYEQEQYDKGINSNNFEVVGNIYENPELLANNK